MTLFQYWCWSQFTEEGRKASKKCELERRVEYAEQELRDAQAALIKILDPRPLDMSNMDDYVEQRYYANKVAGK